MNDILSLLQPKNQWPMSLADNIYGMSAPTYSTPQMSEVDWSALTPIEIPETTENPLLSATDTISYLPTRTSAEMDMPTTQDAFNKFVSGDDSTLTNAQKALFQGAIIKTVVAASDFFTRATGLGGIIDKQRIDKQRDVAIQNYQNQMDALDNQVLYIKNQLSDRFNKTVETNIMNMAARGLRVNAGNVLEQTKSLAQDTTEDMRTAESNARLKQIALTTGQKQAKESARYAKKQLWTGFAQSAINLGLMWETGGGTGVSWGKLYSGYKDAQKTQDAVEAQEFNKLY